MLSWQHYIYSQRQLFRLLQFAILANLISVFPTITSTWQTSDEAPASENTSWGNQPLGSAVRELLLKPRRYSHLFFFPLSRLSSSATSLWSESPVTRQLNHFQTKVYGWSQMHCNKRNLGSPNFPHCPWLTSPTLTYHTYFLRTKLPFISRYGPGFPIVGQHFKAELQ